MQIHIVLAIFLGVINSFRKLEVAKQRPEDHPRVPASDFARWRKKELFAYNLAIWSSFLMVLCDLGWQYFARNNQPDPALISWGGRIIFLCWGSAMVASFLMGTAGRALRGELGIVLGRRPKDS